MIETMKKEKITDFMDLIAWQRGHEAVLAIYQLTQVFPASERFGLTNQLRRAAVSITSNIAEGFSRQTIREKVQFYFISKGSICECRDQLLIAKDLGYVTISSHTTIEALLVETHKLLSGLIKSMRLSNA
jgi:four helix bundle protein